MAITVSAQEKVSNFQIEIGTVHSNCNILGFKSSYGGEIHFNKIINKQSFGIGFSRLHYHGNGFDYYPGPYICYGTPPMIAVEFSSKWFNASFNYNYTLLSYKHFAVAVGLYVSLNKMKIREKFNIEEDVLPPSVYHLNDYDVQMDSKAELGGGANLGLEYIYNAFSASFNLALGKVGGENSDVCISRNFNQSITLKYTFGR